MTDTNLLGTFASHPFLSGLGDRLLMQLALTQAKDRYDMPMSPCESP